MTAITHQNIPGSISVSRSVPRPRAERSVSAPMSADAARRLPRRVYLVRRSAVVLAAVGLVAVVLGGRASASRPSSEGELPLTDRPVYIVQPGDTLWAIAESLAPEADPRGVVDRLARAAGGAMLQPGQTIVLPPGLGE